MQLLISGGDGEEQVVVFRKAPVADTALEAVASLTLAHLSGLDSPPTIDACACWRWPPLRWLPKHGATYVGARLARILYREANFERLMAGFAAQTTAAAVRACLPRHLGAVCTFDLARAPNGTSA